MAVRATRVGQAAAVANSVALPAGCQAGDLMLVWAYRDGSNTAPTRPAGWTAIGGGSQGANTNSAAYGFRRFVAGDTTTGTWTNATEIIVIVFRDAITNQDGLGFLSGTNGSSNSMNYKGVTTSEAADTSSIYVQFGGHRTATDVTNAPTGYTSRANAGGVSVFTDEDGSTSTTDIAVTVNATSGWCTNVFEVKSKLDLIASAISVVGFDGASTNTVSLAGISWQVGDLAMVLAWNATVGLGTPQPTLPAGWTTYGAGAGASTTTGTTKAGYRHLQSGDTDIGVWTNATDVMVVVFRSTHTTDPKGQLTGDGNTSTVAVNWVGLNTDLDDSIVLAFLTNADVSYAPEGMTHIGTVASSIIAWWSVEGTPHMPTTLSRTTPGIFWRTAVYEIKAGIAPAPSDVQMFQAWWID